MRRLLIFVTVALVGFAPLAGTSVFARGQEWTDEAFIGVTIEEGGASMEPLDAFLGTTGSVRERIPAGNLVTFKNSGEQRAHVPEVPEAPFMAVYVAEGEFVLDVMAPTSFIVDPGDERPSGDQRVVVFDVAITGDNEVAEYTMDPENPNYLRDEMGNECTEMCTVPAPRADDATVVEEDKRTAVQLLRSDWVIAPAGGLCVWCLLNAYAEGGDTGQLFVYPLSDEPFAWSVAKSATPSADQGGAAPLLLVSDDGVDAAEPLTNAMAWAFNPAPNCRGG